MNTSGWKYGIILVVSIEGLNMVENKGTRTHLDRLYLSGFKSISVDRPMNLELGRINILLGANGSGKSNLLSVVPFLNAMNNGALQQYVAMQGAQALLHCGPQKTSSIIIRLDFSDPSGNCSSYNLSLKYGLPSRLYIADEHVAWIAANGKGKREYAIYSDSNESGLRQYIGDYGAEMAFRGMTSIYVYQFNNTAIGAPIRIMSGIYDCAVLRSDGGNLAAYLRQLKVVDEYRPYYERIVAFVRSVVPQFGDFRLDEVNNGSVWLTWQDRSNPSYVYGPQQLSDGSIRFIALAAALLSPPKLMPGLVFLDEPELGLHPHAIDKLAGMVKIASVNSQVVVATQAPRLVDGFEVDQVRLLDVDRLTGGTIVSSPDSDALGAWIGRYSTSEMWDRNILNAYPSTAIGGSL